jgi:hypothetical protein
MPSAGDSAPNFLGSGRTLGLSGDVGRVLPPLPDLRFFAQFLQRHRVQVDLVGDPTPLWDGAGAAGGRVGLRRHIVDEPQMGPGHISDILLILSREDWERAREQREGRWLKLARGLISERLLAYCIANGLPTGSAGRDIGVQIVGEGSQATGGEHLGLASGEFVTGLLPNHHQGPSRGHAADFGVHLHVPGQWPGYREVAQLFPGQNLLTLGTHWLDNFRHPSLRAAGLYQLQRDGEGGLLHLVNPDLAERYRVMTRESAAGQPVVALEDRTGRAVAFLAVTALSQVELPPIGGLGDVTLQPSGTSQGGALPSASLTPSMLGQRVLTLVEQGALLQRVHFRSVMTGYDVLVGHRGELGNAVADPAARFRVDGEGVSLIGCGRGLTLDGEPLTPGQSARLEGDHVVHIGGTMLEFRDLNGVEVDGWPYLAEVRRPGGSVHATFGSRFRIGRERTCRVRLPDDTRNENIRWRETVDDQAAIHSRHGSLSRDRFYTDSILVASEHAEVDLTGEPVLYGVARSCWTFVRRAGDVLALPPARRAGGAANIDLLPGDEILVGNCVFEVRYPPADHARDPAQLPRDRGPLSAAELAAAADELDPDPTSARRLPKVERAPRSDDAPAAAGLGERGPAPARVAADMVASVDSLLDEVLEPTLPAPPPVASPRSHTARGSSGGLAPGSSEAGAGTPSVGLRRDAVGVSVVDESAIQVELSRSARLVLMGWRRGGRLDLGNYVGADGVVPELASLGAPSYSRVDLAQVHADEGAVLVVPQTAKGLRLRLGKDGEVCLEVDRHDAHGEVDLTVRLSLHASPAGEVSADIELDDRMVQGLFTLGLPLRADRTVVLGGHPALVHFDGQIVRYGFDAPPPGTAARGMLSPGDRLLVGCAVYRFETTA